MLQMLLQQFSRSLAIGYIDGSGYSVCALVARETDAVRRVQTGDDDPAFPWNRLCRDSCRDGSNEINKLDENWTC